MNTNLHEFFNILLFLNGVPDLSGIATKQATLNKLRTPEVDSVF
jgi:hypothetical protein